MHPYFDRYLCVIQANNYNNKQILELLRMVRLKERRLGYAFKRRYQKKEKVEDLAKLCGVKKRRFQQLYADYKMNGEIPKLKKNRRPKTFLTEGQILVIDKALKESLLRGAFKLRLYIKKYYGENIPHNKIHSYMRKKGVSKEDKKKQEQRKYCRYVRDHSFSLVHLDWHDSKAVKGKYVCVVEDDCSRQIICGNEFNNEKEENNIRLMEEAIDIVWEKYSAIIREANSDKGSQFYCNTKNKWGERGESKFEKFLAEQNINHIPSRKSHPQTNGKEERWFRTYEENRHNFKSFKGFQDWYNNMIHLGLSRREGITPNEQVINKLQPESILGLFLRMVE